VVARHAGGGGSHLVEQQVGKADPGPLDTRGAERLLALEGGVEELRVGQLGADAGELAERGVGSREREDELAAVRQARRQGRRDEGGVAFGTGDDPARGGGMKLTGIDGGPSLPS
jgi:hypothetical protein